MSSCWQCGEAVPEADLFCPACDTLQPPRPGRSHFEVLGIPPRFEVDLVAMERAFKGLSRQLHPDRFALESAAVRRLSMEHATALNDAYRALKRAVSLDGDNEDARRGFRIAERRAKKK